MQSIEYFSFLLSDTETWSSPAVTGTKPPPCSDFSLTLTDPDHAVLFGGHQCGEGRGRTNDTYILDLRNMVSCGYSTLWVKTMGTVDPQIPLICSLTDPNPDINIIHGYFDVH